MSLLDEARAAGQQGSADFPAPVSNRIAHIDADFIAYWVSAETKDELSGDAPRRSLQDMQRAVLEIAEYQMRLAGATSYRLYVNPRESNKGGRDEQAIQCEYQAARKGRKDKPEHLHAIRTYIADLPNGRKCLDRETDDALASIGWTAHQRGLADKHVIVSRDKDLRMVPGLHLDLDTNEIVLVEGFGEVYLDKSKSSAKVSGWGTSYFWAQCLTGDAADSILGLPKVAKADALRVSPTGKWEKLRGTYHRLVALDAPLSELEVARDRLEAEAAGLKPCGPSLAVQLLSEIKTNRDAFYEILRLWRGAEHAGYEFTYWKTGERVPATRALFGDMQLLWMRRTSDPRDVMRWLKDDVKI